MKKNQFKFQPFLQIKRSKAFKWTKFVKFRQANSLQIYWLGLDILIGLPYLPSFIYQQGKTDQWNESFNTPKI